MSSAAQLGVALGQWKGDALIRTDGPAEHDALVGVGDRLAQRHLADAEGFGGDEDALGVQSVDEVLEATALLADAVGDLDPRSS